MPLTEVASERARSAQIDNIDFVVADAQTHAFAPGTFDLVVCQFGVMFFDDPAEAFSNLRRSLVPGGRLALVSWQGLSANEWLTVIAGEVAKRAEIPEFGGLSRTTSPSSPRRTWSTRSGRTSQAVRWGTARLMTRTRREPSGRSAGARP